MAFKVTKDLRNRELGPHVRTRTQVLKSWFPFISVLLIVVDALVHEYIRGMSASFIRTSAKDGFFHCFLLVQSQCSYCVLGRPSLAVLRFLVVPLGGLYH